MIAQNAGGAISYYVYNAHGDTTALFDTNGNRVYKYDIGAFGNNLSNSGTGTAAKFVYNGQYYDSETGLYYLRNRYYDPTTGRFTQEDPAKDGLNWYVYCGNDPVNFVDPWGLKPGDLFETEDLLALDFAMNYAEISATEEIVDEKGNICIGREYGSVIYSIETENGTMYSYTEPDRADINNTRYGAYMVNLTNTIDKLERSGEKITGTIHTHYPDGMLTASAGDKILFKKYTGKNYLIAPSGKISRYQYNSKTNRIDERDLEFVAYYNVNSLMFNLEKPEYKNSYCEKNEYTIDFYNQYTEYKKTKDMLNTYSWKILRNAFPNIEPIEIIRAGISYNSLFEIVNALEALE